ncbi:MAG: hypothetical protein RLZZ30_944 [Bacteroidota bacterium]|jgi:predicted DNA-binding mobile mystery protein A
MKQSALHVNQLNRKIGTFQMADKVSRPNIGWIKTIRKGLGMSSEQLAKKLQITRQSVLSIEQREKNGSITLKNLELAAQAMDMKLVYGVVPKDGSLDKLIERKALQLATEIVLRASDTMHLEGQGNSPERIKKAIKERAKELKEEMPKKLWD